MEPERFENVEELHTAHHAKLVNLNPSQSFTFDLANACPNSYLRTKYLRIAVLDSQIPPAMTDTVKIEVAAMVVPVGRETNWMYTTEEGYLQLRHENSKFSRIILIGNTTRYHTPTSFFLGDLNPIPSVDDIDADYWTAFIMYNDLCPVSSDVKFLTNIKDEDVVFRIVHEEPEGQTVGRMLIETVGLKRKDDGIEFRRRLTFKRTPNVIQTELPLFFINPRIETVRGLSEVIINKQRIRSIVLYTRGLIQQNLNAMVTGLSLIPTFNLDWRIQNEQYKPRALCIGVGGGALLSFLAIKLQFEVVGVEVSRDVLSLARLYFRLDVGPFLRLILGDGIKLIKALAKIWDETSNHYVALPKVFQELNHGGKELLDIEDIDARFDVLMVDLVTSSVPATAPPSEFIKWSVLESAKYILDEEHGVLVINVLRRLDDRSSYDKLVRKLRMIFGIVFEIKVGTDEANVVLIATMSSEAVLDHQPENSFSKTVRSVISKLYMRSMTRI